MQRFVNLMFGKKNNEAEKRRSSSDGPPNSEVKRDSNTFWDGLARTGTALAQLLVGSEDNVPNRVVDLNAHKDFATTKKAILRSIHNDYGFKDEWNAVQVDDDKSLNYENFDEEAFNLSLAIPSPIPSTLPSPLVQDSFCSVVSNVYSPLSSAAAKPKPRSPLSFSDDLNVSDTKNPSLKKTPKIQSNVTIQQSPPIVTPVHDTTKTFTEVVKSPPKKKRYTVSLVPVDPPVSPLSLNGSSRPILTAKRRISSPNALPIQPILCSPNSNLKRKCDPVVDPCESSEIPTKRALVEIVCTDHGNYVSARERALRLKFHKSSGR